MFDPTTQKCRINTIDTIAKAEIIETATKNEIMNNLELNHDFENDSEGNLSRRELEKQFKLLFKNGSRDKPTEGVSVMRLEKHTLL